MKKSNSRYALTPLRIAMVFALGAIPPLVLAQENPAATVAREHYEIPAAPLNTMLLNIARQSGRVISFEPTLVAPYQGRAVRGNMTAEQAIAACLQGTELVLDVTANGTLTVTSAPAVLNVAPTNITATDAQLPSIAVNGSALSDDQLYYNPSNSSSVSRTDTPLKQTAQSVDVLSAKLLKDRQATNLSDALKSSPGVQQTVSNRGGAQYKIRGFLVEKTSTNGMPNAGVNGSSIQGIERVEVIKGPDSIMSGSSTPGGTINIIRKAPVKYDVRTLSLEVADYGELKQGLDLGGALNEDRSLSYRLNLSNMKSDNASPDFDGKRDVFVAPALTWEGEHTRLTFGAEYGKQRQAAPYSTMALNGKIQKLPTYRVFRKDDGFRSENKTGYYEFSQDLIDDWTFNSKATYVDNTDTLRLWQLNAFNQDGSVVFASPFSAVNNSKSWSLQNDIRGKFKTGFITHKVLVGVDYQHILTVQNDRDVPGERGSYPQVNIYDTDSLDLLPKVGGATYRSSDRRTQQRGLILQDQMDVGDRTHVLLAAKKAKWISDGTVYSSDGTASQSPPDVAEKWVPNVGISYDVSPQMTVYANVIHGFNGSSGYDTTTFQLLPPLTSESKEVGAKFSFLDDALTLTTAYFELQQDNVPLTDPITRRNIGIQSQESKGYDFTLTGELVPGWNIAAGYTHVKYVVPKLAKGDTSEFSSQPGDTATLWTSYELQEGRYKGFGAGLGMVAFSNAIGGIGSDSYEIPGGASTDLSVFYHAKEYSLTLGVKNVFDRTLYYGSGTSAFIPLREERNARLTFVYNF
ncbi:TonB-dependent siderophore receptor [Pseudomonas trivialis]|uniref:Iron complex outermembrane recepter protein n=1 Tax=Pseudomonas trivialis TaxID=200450 RepID=A0ABY0UN71_9PSED|nr:TonB-dependent receptor [Pseudomonas trivialis]SDS94077.1 iron complex outermembrane recepter protein [Pseudomonas trivialis]